MWVQIGIWVWVRSSIESEVKKEKLDNFFRTNSDAANMKRFTFRHWFCCRTLNTKVKLLLVIFFLSVIFEIWLWNWFIFRDLLSQWLILSWGISYRFIDNNFIAIIYWLMCNTFICDFFLRNFHNIFMKVTIIYDIISNAINNNSLVEYIGNIP